MPRAKRIEVIRRGIGCHVLVDGVELPAAMPRDSHVVVAVNPDERPTVTVTLTADHVTVTDALQHDEKENDR
ncbi:hypothetical protein [Streptomyces stelliscabiei]|uniref:hypothetical protein n=1 Tax=Streptomyces stelliscabiei TaxID=146820 RepID=UPI0029AD2A02|nr:hypothetical protein [Streptomyces stelliscabiei]MDX2667388.1 hypothetical protein [Streptomyces stelliscabiei]MDX2785927.1 hypothetical protein [Streptomyces stelliscabiei]